MGGYGSGRWLRYLDKDITAQYASANINDVHRTHALRPGATVRVAGFPLTLAWTPCNLGGSRPWFVCPGCYRRIGVVYRAGSQARCRKCFNLAYSSQREDAYGRAIDRAVKIRRRLGQKDGGLGVPIPWKPPRMHWRTYSRLCDEASAHEGRAFAALAAKAATITSWPR